MYLHMIDLKWHYSKWKKPISQYYILYNSTYMKRETFETESRSVTLDSDTKGSFMEERQLLFEMGNQVLFTPTNYVKKLRMTGTRRNQWP